MGSISLVVSCLLLMSAANADLVNFDYEDSTSLLDYMFMDALPPANLPADDGDPVPISQSAVILDEAPTSNWWYGCSATSAGMMFGYYDRIGYVDLYDNPIPDSLDTDTSIIATDDHVTDYWVSSGSTGPDPWEDNWTEHTWADCPADFMGTNQWKWDLDGDGNRDSNADGSTTLWMYNSATKLSDYIPPEEDGTPRTALCHGLRWFAESRGYTVVENYTQRIHEDYAGGFTFADYMAEIDAGWAPLIQIDGHTMLGVGYDTSGNTMYIHDTWGNDLDTMTWAGSYGGMSHQAMTIIHLDPADRVPEPGTLVVMLLGLACICIYSRRRFQH